MKKVFMVLFVFVMVICIGTVAQASSYQQDVMPTSFFVVDKNGDGSVMLMVLNSTANQVEYSTNQSDWKSLGALEFEPFTMEPEGQQLVYWRHVDVEIDYTADLLFFGSGGDDLWDSVTIFWDGMDVLPINGDPPSTTITFGMPVPSDRVAPVPIPASALLLGSGMVGLIAFGQRMRKKIL